MLESAAVSIGKRRVVAGVAIALVAMSIVLHGAPRLGGLVQLASQLASLTMEQRRSTLFGAWYLDVQRLKQAIPQNAAVDLVLMRPEARDLAVLSGPMLQPRDCRYFDGWDGWTRRKRVDFFQDARAANAPPAPPPLAASFLVEVDPAATDRLLLVRRPP